MLVSGGGNSGGGISAHVGIDLGSFDMSMGG